MPLLRQVRFIKKEIPRNIQDDDKIFFLDLTGEIFTEYEEYCYRVIQCNSLVWTCEETGNAELTYAEALESERSVQNTLSVFPDLLKVPTLFLCLIAKSSSFRNISLDVYNYIQDHFFVNEIVIPTTEENWTEAKVIAVKNPTEKSSLNVESPLRKRQYTPPGWLVYEVDSNFNGDEREIHYICGAKLRRPRDINITKDTVSMFIKRNISLNAHGDWVIKESVLEEYAMQLRNFNNIFVDNSPFFRRNMNIIANQFNLEECTTAGNNSTISSVKSDVKQRSMSVKSKRMLKRGAHSSRHDNDKQRTRSASPSHDQREWSNSFYKNKRPFPSFENSPHASQSVTPSKKQRDRLVTPSRDEIEQRSQSVTCIEINREKSTPEKDKKIESSVIGLKKQLEQQNIDKYFTSYKKLGDANKENWSKKNDRNVERTFDNRTEATDTELYNEDTECSSDNEVKMVWSSHVKSRRPSSDKFPDSESQMLVMECSREVTEELKANNEMDMPEDDAEKTVSSFCKLEKIQKEVIEKKQKTPGLTTSEKRLKQSQMLANQHTEGKPRTPKELISNKASFRKFYNKITKFAKKKVLRNLKPVMQATKKVGFFPPQEAEVTAQENSLPTSCIEGKNWLEVQRIMELNELKRNLEVERRTMKTELEEERIKFAKFMKEWKMHREDLLCEDLKPLPVPCIVDFRVPNELFGDFVTILEFFHTFSTPIKVKKWFPRGLTFEHLERALVEGEIAGPLIDIIHVLLLEIFNLQISEHGKPKSDIPISVDLNLGACYEENVAPKEAISQHVVATGWNNVFQGVPLHDIPLNHSTISEVLRLHLLNSGGRTSDNSFKWSSVRSGQVNFEDPGLWLRIERSSILMRLCTHHVCELALDEKLEILSCLINQVLTYANIRDILDIRGEQARKAKVGLKSLQVAKLKLQREAASLRYQGIKDAKLSKSDSRSSNASEEYETEKQDLEKKINTITMEIQKKHSKILSLSMGYQHLPMGCDRAHRKFWLFSSLPGLFVEKSPSEIGPCLKHPTPQVSEMADTLSHVRRLFKEDSCNPNSDKENYVFDIDDSKMQNINMSKVLNEQETSSENINEGGGVKADRIEGTEHLMEREFLICTASDNCPVHVSSVSKSVWSFYPKEENVSSLLESLNERGIREDALRRSILHERQRVIESINQCPVHKLNPAKFQSREGQQEQRPSTRSTFGYSSEKARLSYPPNSSISHIMEWKLRDSILKLEDKIVTGCIGSLKVNDRSVWRLAIESGNYNKQCDKLLWGVKRQYSLQKEVVTKNRKIDEDMWSPSSDDDDDDITEDKSGRGTNAEDKSESGSFFPNADRSDQELEHDNGDEDDCSSNELQNSLADRKGQSNGVDLKNYESNKFSYGPESKNPIVKELACAILQLGQSVDPKFLQKPLANVKKSGNSCMNHWEVSLMNAVNFSQLFIHHSTLESSINWSKSTLNAPCCICRRRGNADKMLLCDGCNRGYHMFCLKPKLKVIPDEEWYCTSCVPVEKRSTGENNKGNVLENSDISNLVTMTVQKKKCEK